MMADSKVGRSLKQASRDLKNAFLNKVCREIEYAANSSVSGKIPYGFITKLMNEAKAEEPWINRNIINFAYKKFCEKKKTTKDPSPETESDNSSNKQHLKRKGGRPKGSTLF